MAERLADEIPAGSSAATAGGGSGFNSPVSTVDPSEGDEARRATREARRQLRAASKQPSLKKAETSDSMITNGNDGASRVQ